MNSGQIFWFGSGVLSALAVLVAIYPWLAGKPRAQLFGVLPRWAPMLAIVAVVGALGLYLRLGSPQLNERDSVAAGAASTNSAPMTPPATSSKAAASMDSAVIGLEKRLAAGGGSEGDWELLAKSYEFMGRSDDAAVARRKQLPAGAGSSAASLPDATVVGAVAGVVRGEVVLADALRGKVPAGLTLFILAKSVNSPGAPVAILRLTTATWPVTFQLDDSLAMLPERKLSTAGPVTIEARTSRTGQAMPAPGDFQGATAPLNPAAGKPVRVVIQRVIG